MDAEVLRFCQWWPDSQVCFTAIQALAFVLVVNSWLNDSDCRVAIH